MLNVPKTVHQQEPRCPARADPYHALKSAAATAAVAVACRTPYTFEERYVDDDVLNEDADSLSVL